ncbi:MAG: argininosuccinate lyase [Thermodesulfobacteriota bacterium]|nr:argininosuccinate lyase [Thermodesulfobacteriota bacterium]
METKKLWSGRFQKELSEIASKFSQSISFDQRLYSYDIIGSIAHVLMLAQCSIITEEEKDAIVSALTEIKGEIESGNFHFTSEKEDIHMHIESKLLEKVGDVGGKLHTARSRNDQVALDIRLYMKDQIKTIIELLLNLQSVLINLAANHMEVIIPGFTHLQHAQPVLFSHHMLAYYEMFKRDIERLEDCYQRVDILPLGACALAGTSFPIDRHYVAELLGFSQISENSIDTVSDRDFIIEFLSFAAIFGIHISRLGEEIVIWSSKEFSFITLPDDFTTGSSIMPQKKNPDIAELSRGKSGRLLGNLVSVATSMKGLPLSYNRDMQEDKEPLFDTIDTVISILNVFPPMLEMMKVENKNMMKILKDDFITATDLADYLVKKGVPFRESHQIIGNVVLYCMERGKRFEDLEIRELKEFSEKFSKDVYRFISIENAVNERTSYGGTALHNVKQSRERAEVEIRDMREKWKFKKTANFS